MGGKRMMKINLLTMMVFFKIKTKTKRKERQTALFNENVKTKCKAKLLMNRRTKKKTRYLSLILKEKDFSHIFKQWLVDDEYLVELV
jgi:hypothetical protein